MTNKKSSSKVVIKQEDITEATDIVFVKSVGTTPGVQKYHAQEGHFLAFIAYSKHLAEKENRVPCFCVTKVK